MLKDFVKVATVEDIADGQMIDVEVAGEEVCLARIGDAYYAVNNVCTHFYTWLSGGYLYPEKLEVQCPLHDSRFSLTTGEPTGPPATEPVKTYAVRVDGRDILIGPTEAGQ